MIDIIEKEYDSFAVYIIINAKKNKIYVGSTSNYLNRSRAHASALQSGKHICKEMQEDFNESPDDFTIRIYKKLPIALKNDLLDSEAKAIKELKADHELYNQIMPEHTHYFNQSNLLRLMADEYCKEHFGDTFYRFTGNKTEAFYEMIYYLIKAKTEEEKEQIKKKYEPIIQYHNKKHYYRYRLGLDYDYLYYLPKEEQKEVIRRAKEERKHKYAG